jgi:hypothetical protein
MANQRNSPLLRLPAELRNRIYELVFHNTTLCVIQLRTLSLTMPASRSSGLLHTCRQTRNEASGILFSQAIFALDSMSEVDILLAKIGARRCRTIPAVSSSRYLTYLILDFRTLGLERHYRSRWSSFEKLCEFTGLRRVYVFGDRMLMGDKEETITAVRDCLGSVYIWMFSLRDESGSGTGASGCGDASLASNVLRKHAREWEQQECLMFPATLGEGEFPREANASGEVT